MSLIIFNIYFKMQRSNILFSVIFFFFFNYFFSQNIQILNIENGLIFLENNSEEFKQLKNNSEINVLKSEVFDNIFLPKVNLTSSIPAYNKSINAITLPNGNNTFIEQSQANSSLSFNIAQPLTFLGGDLTISSSINRLDNLTSKSNSFSSNWFNLSYSQPINGFNKYKWYKKISEAQLKKDKVELLKKIENEKKIFINDYFEVYINSVKIELTKKNIQITNNYLKQVEVLYEESRVLKPELLKTKLYINQLKFNLSTDLLNYKISTNILKAKLGINNKDSIVLLEPPLLEKPIISKLLLKERSLKYTLNNEFELDLLESAQKLANIKSTKGIQINFQAGYGLNSRADGFNNLYDIPSRREFLNFGISIPIINWGENTRLYKIQNLIHENLKSQYIIETKKLDNNLIEYLNYFESLFFQIQVWKENNEIAMLNSNISETLLTMNRLTINDYSQELFKEEKAMVDYLYSLKSIWEFKYTLRKNLLYDFFENKQLD